MRIVTKVFLTAILVAALAVTAAAGAQAQTDAGEDSAAVATNTRDGSSVFKLAFHIKRVMDSDVDADNAAVAYASCTDCQTVATSIQVVLVMSDPESVTTDNVAIAVNYDCTECETLAAAYQYVFGNGDMVRFTPEGQRKLAQIRRQLQLLRQEDLTLEELAARIGELAGQVAEVVDDELVASGPASAPADATTTSTAPPASTTTSTTTSAGDSESTTTTTSSESETTTTTAAG